MFFPLDFFLVGFGLGWGFFNVYIRRSVLHGMAHSLCPLAVPIWKPTRPHTLLACTLEFSSLGNWTHTYTVTKSNKYKNNYFLNGTKPYIFILLLEEI